MGSEIGTKIRKVVVISIRGGFRSACNHPFLLGFLCFLLLLYRSFPFLFSVLVSASPVLVCTAILLGTLLSFGQPNVPEVEKEEKVTHSLSSFQAGFSEGETVFSDRDENYFVKGYSQNKSDVEERGIEEASLVAERDNRTEEDQDLRSELPPDDVDLLDIQPEKKNRGEVEGERELHSFELGKNKEIHEENLTSEAVSSDEEAIEKQYVLVQKMDDDTFEFENEKPPRDHVDFSASSSWKQVENDDDGDDNVSVESGSDGAESSSPDASMADIIPILDELHPLLDLDAPQPAHVSRDGSDAESEKSQNSDDDSVESDEDTENPGDVEDDGIDEPDDEEEEEAIGGKEDESKSAIKWTEDDQKNLMDLGNLELERNTRLENLIARRRQKRLISEKNLIDLDFVDIPSNVAPIATARRNPFDFPDDSFAAMGLPPIPGSAPSILQPRRNPFDIPYDSNEEKPDLKGDSFQQEFTVFHQKDALFRRHESFSVGPSVLGLSRQERYDWKPVFVSERMASEGTSYSSFHRQSSEVSDSKLSSVPDTESLSSIDQDDRKFSEQDLSQENELVSNMDNASDVVEHGSQSSEENDSVEMIQIEESNVRHDEVEIVLGGVENPSEMAFYPETGEVEIHEQFNAGETHLRREPGDEESDSHSSRSSHSSLSEVIDSMPDEKIESLQGDDHVSTQASVQESNLQHVSSSEVEDNHHVEPVYDSSPQASETLQSFPSLSSHDSALEFSERAMPPASVETANVADKELDVHDHRQENNTSDHDKTQAASSEHHVEAQNALTSEKSEDVYVAANELSAANTSTVAEPQVIPVSVDANLSSDMGSITGVINSGLVHGQDVADHIHADSEILHQDNINSVDSDSEKSHISDNESLEESALPNEISRSFSANVSVLVQDADEMLDSGASDAHHISSDGSFMPAQLDLQLSPAAGPAPVDHPSPPSEESGHTEIFLSNNAGIYQIQQDKALTSSVEQGEANIYEDLDKNVVVFTSDSQHESDEKPSSNMENHKSISDKSVVEPSFSDHDESQSSSAIHIESAQSFGRSNDETGELQDATQKVQPSISSVTSEKSQNSEFGSPSGEVDLEVDRHGAVERDTEVLETALASEESMSQVTEENSNEFDDMKEIDEGFLSELDTVGDFRVNDAGVSLRTDTEHEKTGDSQVFSLPKDVKIEEIEQGIPVLEARSLEDVNLAFKQLQEGVDVKEVILPSTIKDQHAIEESKDHLEANSDLEVVEARSLEDINIALKQASEGNKGELPNSLDLKATSVKVEENGVGSSKVNESSSEETNRTTADKSENIPISGSSDKAKSHSRKSTSSSSSSSSSSDSD
ncbi:uncharacterized protein HKW66_Vig0047140 [Vigna angularis]|uniref:Uncharacterized protein n=2 Tax=Phaseolus angularis TaxID=3914 RepID=A0A8T0L145_PHAAN|nr:uncharacterized protein LOC108329082 [Vigna angularis]XP_017418574.1 uncharacterized protein LOC108329082 [Vigna angularis]KAG2405459.1 uncharacterized protein HKW66_Vig0047140 [Vigna angularis]BAT85030.1 hypothetical protein VIGAN_04252100 [Vigna angularis var. angularis]